MYDLIIIGGGPAALSAATFALGKCLKTLVIADTFGGKAGWQQRLVGQVGEEYLAGAESVKAFQQRITQANCALRQGRCGNW